MNIYIPHIGDELILSEPWTFGVYSERRNDKLLKDIFGSEYKYWSNYGKKVAEKTLIPGTSLKVDRIYIKKGQKDYNSVTFWAAIPGIKGKTRFWAKLDDVNTMVAELM